MASGPRVLIMFSIAGIISLTAAAKAGSIPGPPGPPGAPGPAGGGGGGPSGLCGLGGGGPPGGIITISVPTLLLLLCHGLARSFCIPLSCRLALCCVREMPLSYLWHSYPSFLFLPFRDFSTSRVSLIISARASFN